MNQESDFSVWQHHGFYRRYWELFTWKLHLYIVTWTLHGPNFACKAMLMSFNLKAYIMAVHINEIYIFIYACIFSCIPIGFPLHNQSDESWYFWRAFDTICFISLLHVQCNYNIPLIHCILVLTMSKDCGALNMNFEFIMR